MELEEHEGPGLDQASTTEVPIWLVLWLTSREPPDPIPHRNPGGNRGC